MNLDHLKTFHVVARLQSFTKASKALFLTQPTVSLQIQGLEHSLKVQLFDRSKKQIALTPEGKVLYSYTNRLFDVFNEIESAFQSLNELQNGQIDIAASAVVANYYLPKIVAGYRQLYPDIALNIRVVNSEQVAELVTNRDVDFGISARIVGKPELVQYQLLSERYVVVASPSSKWAQLERPLTPQEFVQGSIITREKGARSQSKLNDWIRTQGISKFHGGCAVNSMDVAKQLAVCGLGLVTLPELTVSEEIRQGALVPVEVEGFNIHTGYYLSYLKDTNVSRAALKFFMLLKENRRDFMAML